jgi:chromosome segregation ATPase
MPGFDLSEPTKEKLTEFDMIARLSMMVKEAVGERDEREEMRKLALKDINDLYESIHLHFTRLGKYHYGHSALEKVAALIDEYINLSGQINPIKHKLEVANNHLEAQKKVTAAKEAKIVELKNEIKGLEVTLEEIEKVCTEAGIDTSTLDHEGMVESVIRMLEAVRVVYEQRATEAVEIHDILIKAGYYAKCSLKDKVSSLVEQLDMCDAS